MFSEDKKKALVPTMTLCFKAVVNMKDEDPLNFDTFHLCVKLFIRCRKYVTTNKLA